MLLGGLFVNIELSDKINEFGKIKLIGYICLFIIWTKTVTNLMFSSF